MPCSEIRRNLTNKTRNWTNAQLKTILDTITDDDMKIREASCTFGIPPTSICDHLFGRLQGRKIGAIIVLKEDEEKKIIGVFI